MMKNMKFDTYIFDLDGTLLNTLGDLAGACNYALRQHGYEERSLDEVRRFVGNGVRKLMERALPEQVGEGRVEEVLQTFRQYYLEHQADLTEPYEGIVEMLEGLKQRGCKIAVVSNKFMEATQSLCRHFFGNLIDVAVGEAPGIRRKPAPDAVEVALRELGDSGESAVYVGDSDVDILTAEACHLPCISVLWGFRDEAFLLQHGATRLAHTPSDLL